MTTLGLQRVKLSKRRDKYGIDYKDQPGLLGYRIYLPELKGRKMYGMMSAA